MFTFLLTIETAATAAATTATTATTTPKQKLWHYILCGPDCCSRYSNTLSSSFVIFILLINRYPFIAILKGMFICERTGLRQIFELNCISKFCDEGKKLLASFSRSDAEKEGKSLLSLKGSIQKICDTFLIRFNPAAPPFLPRVTFFEQCF